MQRTSIYQVHMCEYQIPTTYRLAYFCLPQRALLAPIWPIRAPHLNDASQSSHLVGVGGLVFRSRWPFCCVRWALGVSGRKNMVY